ncbi:protein kinase family protein [Mycolicibacterium sp. BiH015]|uniref:protein kinase family protein n=1 Tax=Mycolicibacterium sp. BiH015 TaxID=3018808 RepID=UPI0022DF07DA|nr:protein kinase family protein [Mycolicibacterium sp. BiH015]MDA2893606.1 protein kinase family protein [Mycolicibacterium sp. BiH015]
MTNTEPPGGDTAGLAARMPPRWRLVRQEGVAGPLQFWRAVDTATARPVALTAIVPGDGLERDQVDETLERTARLRALEMSGLARIVDGFKLDDIGVVVTEWVPGGTLREVTDTAPTATASAAALKSLVVTADAAHRAGLVLGVDHPDRVRISSDGRAVLAFPAPLPDSTAADDIRGIGGVFYALLVDRWPPQRVMPDGWVPAELDDAGSPREPAAVKPGVPFLISAAAAGLLRPDSGIADTSVLLALLKQVVPLGQPQVRPDQPAAPTPGSYAVFHARDSVAQVKRARRRLTYTTVAAAAAVALVAVTGLGSTVNDVLDAHDDVVAMDANQLGLTPGRDKAAGPRDPADPPKVLKQGAVDLAVTPVRATVFSPEGRPDNPEDAGNVIDGDLATSWATDRYFDANPFPVFKQGLGLVVTLPEPTKVGTVAIEANTAGTVVQVRTAPNDAPRALSETTELTAPTVLQPGANRITLPTADKTSAVIVWITALSDHRAEISEITINSPALA